MIIIRRSRAYLSLFWATCELSGAAFNLRELDLYETAVARARILELSKFVFRKDTEKAPDYAAGTTFIPT